MPVLDATSINRTSRKAAVQTVVQDQPDLAVCKAELADLRFQIVLKARYASSEGVTGQRRAELNSELVGLRSHYSDKIDEIAMTFGVQHAMETQADVEKNVEVPRNARLSGMMSEEDDNGLA